jgi:hypothetical protein
MVERAEVGPNQHPRDHAIPFGFGEGDTLQFGKGHSHRIDFFKRRHDQQSFRIFQPSFPDGPKDQK